MSHANQSSTIVVSLWIHKFSLLNFFAFYRFFTDTNTNAIKLDIYPKQYVYEIDLWETFSIFCPLARIWILIFVICITFHQTNLLDDVHKVLAVFTGHELRFGIFLSIPLIYWNTVNLVLHWYWNCLPERPYCNLKNNKNSYGARSC